LSLPGWLILGLPGIFLVWKFQKYSPDTREDVLISSYDDIVAAAEEFNEHADDITDLIPSKYGTMDDFDPTSDPALTDITGGVENKSGSIKLDPKKKF
jgi:hypothetical protein